MRNDKPFHHHQNLTEEQIYLNEIGNDMFKLSKSVGRQADGKYTENWINARPKLFEIWQQIIPVLKNQRYLVSTNSYGLNPMNDRPRKMDTEKCQLSAGELSISFILKDRNDYFTFEIIVKAGEKDITNLNKAPLFVIDKEDNTFHLVNSLQDEKLINFFYRRANMSTVLTEHFVDFHNRFLKPLSECYPVAYQAFGTKKIIPYEFNNVIKTNSKNHGA